MGAAERTGPGGSMAEYDVTREWARIVGWLGIMAPLSAAALRAPVAEVPHADLPHGSDAALPGELSRLLALNDGCEPGTPGAAFLPHGNRLMRRAEIGPVAETLNALLDEDVIGSWWHPAWVPFATMSEGSMDCLFIDVRPGLGFGQVGSFFDETGGELGWWPSLGAFLADTARALQEVRPVAAWRPPASAAVGVRPVLPQVEDDILVWRR
ncbi:SMI1/KNR4 family protein [Streptomyces sp. NPDC050448]|uniref:SMI1/KNR4 family protein n=1 Tax=Streptomyces sp. NPDC050448 TaxID=3155404 RepID=UPI00341C1A30